MFKKSFHQKFVKCVNDNFNVQNEFGANFENNSTKFSILSNSINNSLIISIDFYFTHDFDQTNIL